MKLINIKSKKLLILIIVLYSLLILSLLIPIKGYKIDLPGNISPIANEIQIEELSSNGEFYSIYILSYKNPTLFQMLVGNLTDKVDVYKDKTQRSSSLDFFRGALQEELSFQYAIINAYEKAMIEDNLITIDYNLDSYVITYSVNKNIDIGTRFTHVDNKHIKDFSTEELSNYFKDNNSVTLTVLDLENNTTKPLEITKTEGLFGIVYDKYFIINDSNPKYETFYEKDQKVGPSGGLLQTLEIYAILTGKKFNKIISGTGTITPEGKVGPIGGVKQKIYTANKKVDVFFIPESQYDEALKVYNKIRKPTFLLVKVSDFDEAVKTLLSEFESN